jgi:hypothetical protein
MDNTFLVSTTKIHVTDKHFTLLSDEVARNRGGNITFCPIMLFLSSPLSYISVN